MNEPEYKIFQSRDWQLYAETGKVEVLQIPMKRSDKWVEDCVTDMDSNTFWVEVSWDEYNKGKEVE